MRNLILSALALTALAGCQAPGTGLAGERGLSVVYGVEEGDMLKLRAGPGTGFDVYTGLPNGTLVQVRDCDQQGGVRWCRVALERTPEMTGYVSQSYLRRL
ncbi:MULTISPECIES: SH3 domain-containing protein [unclassified Roseivivax]|uniref:SH3 domain-containing protein n=1 Tax=Roseivivax sp. GX 12232 TaxID=2900547 RepID=UPI001E63F060|nr:SH3 domain-containing protein [Roseivivax sp. GX 12232]MCE0505804.1 SH3 domain-containing protein [Roseivivax sp. GX 12232]